MSETNYGTNDFDRKRRMIHLHPDAFALRPVRVLKNGSIRYYEGTTFPGNPWSGCEMYLRRLMFFGALGVEDTSIVIDVLNEEGDILQDFTVSTRGFEYLRRQLGFRVEHSNL